ncbi:uncharacterized protein LOC133744845 [Rosa rugosa]|uniref:uncharacterized protein LOC133744845 n=1 Tax=Rosa rugosa TaxID=74645 RepID=UPI002B40780F|nr:uncharacterized protein LOC133744845 [Rosa rugosa]
MKGKVSMNSSWIIDTGASDHMTNDPSLLEKLKPSSQNIVSTADGTPTPVTGEGSVVLSDTLTLDSVLVVPSLAYNLLSVGQIILALAYFRCDVCELAKSHRISYSPSLNKSPIPFMKIHSDVWGPAKIPSFSGARYYVTFIDDCTRMTWVSLLKNKSDVCYMFQDFHKMVSTQYQQSIRIFQSDNGGEYVNGPMQEFMQSHGIRHQTSNSYTPQQNGLAERKNRQLLEVVRASLFGMHVPREYWGEAVKSATYLINRTPSRVIEFQNPHQKLQQLLSLPSLPNLEPRVFGCVAYVHIPKPQRSKLDPRARKCIFVGYADFQKGYRCYDPVTGTMYVSLDVAFRESEPYYLGGGSESSLQGERDCEGNPRDLFAFEEFEELEALESRFGVDSDGAGKENERKEKEVAENEKGPAGGELTVGSAGNESARMGEESAWMGEREAHHGTTGEESHHGTTGEESIRMGEREGEGAVIQNKEGGQMDGGGPVLGGKGSGHIDEPVGPSEEQVFGSSRPYCSSRQIAVDPTCETSKDAANRKSCSPSDGPLPTGPATCEKSTKDTLIRPHLSEFFPLSTSSTEESAVNVLPQDALADPKWTQAMNEELKALQKNLTWDVVTMPAGKKTVGCRWVFTVKLKADGSIDRYKARLVAKGYTQRYGIDYEETFAPVAKINTVRILISLAATKDWPLHQFDVKNAFLNGNLEEEVYMDMPPGVKSMPCDTGKVCKLKKSLYGLKQSPRAWFGRFSKSMKVFGYRQSNSDHTLFIKRSQGKITALIVYVDDMIVTGDDPKEMEALQDYLSKKGISLSQRKYVLDLLTETGMLDCNPIETPIEMNHNLAIYPDQVPTDKGSEDHMDAVYRILRYLKMAPGRGLLFEKKEELEVVGYTDADWAGDKTDRRSTSGYFTFVGGNLVTWRSKKQKM